jgi:hypothetical protein
VNTLPKDKVAGMVGSVTGIAGALLVAAIVVPADPLGRLIGALLAASIVVGCVGTLLRSPMFTHGSMRRGPRPSPIMEDQPEGPAAVVSVSALDATAWTFDDKTPDFAPVVSLTEARVARRELERQPCEATEA